MYLIFRTRYILNIHKTFKSNHRRSSIKKAVLKNFAILRRTPVLESLFNKVAGLQAFNFIKKRLYHRCFSVNIAKFFRTPILKKTANGCFWAFRRRPERFGLKNDVLINQIKCDK